jgi:hypothetical protein
MLLGYEVPGELLPPTARSGSLDLVHAGRVRLDRKRLAGWAATADCESLIPSVRLTRGVPQNAAPPSMTIALVSEMAALLNAEIDPEPPETAGHHSSWQVIPSSRHRAFHPVAAALSPGKSATFQVRPSSRRISDLQLTLARPDFPTVTLRIPLSRRTLD